MTDHEEIAATIIVNGVLVSASVCFLALIVAITEPRPVVNEVGLDDNDLYRAVEQCIPWDANFEQELACYQAVYGGD